MIGDPGRCALTARPNPVGNRKIVDTVRPAARIEASLVGPKSEIALMMTTLRPKRPAGGPSRKRLDRQAEGIETRLPAIFSSG
jgi:hypothetical protein